MKGSMKFPKINPNDVEETTGIPTRANPKTYNYGYSNSTENHGLSRQLTVYDTLPSTLGGYDYHSWTKEWLPRLAGSRAGRRPTTLSRNPVGFAIEVKRSTTLVPQNQGTDINPTVLHFSGSTIKRKEDGPGPRSPRNTKDKSNKPLRRVYSKSPFRREPDLENQQPYDIQLSSLNTPSASFTSLPAKVHGNGTKSENSSPRYHDPMRNDAQTKDKQYIVISQTLNQQGQSNIQPEKSCDHLEHPFNVQLSKQKDVQFDTFGQPVQALPYTQTHFSIPGKGTLHLGNSWKSTSNGNVDENKNLELTVRNCSFHKDMTERYEKVKVKDILESGTTFGHVV